MYTQCPDCQTRFRVTAVTLRAAHGTVRCGRCGGAFDALERLSDSIEAPAKPVVLEPLVISVAPIEFPSLIGRVLEESASEPTEVLVDESRTTQTITLEGERVSVEDGPEFTEPYAAPEMVEELPIEFELEDDLDATDRYETLQIPASEFPDEREAERELEALVQRLQREFGSDIVEADELSRRAEETAETEFLAESATPELAHDEPVFVDVSPNGAVTSVPGPWVKPVTSVGAPRLEPEPPVEVVAAPEPATARTPASVPQALTQARTAAAPDSPRPAAASRLEELPLSARRFRSAPVETAEESAPQRSAWPTLAWTAGSLLLALALAAQVVHHWRDTLARDARAGGMVRAAYERVGLALPPSRDLAALELRQLGVDERGEGRMVVRASLTNRAAFAQPMPILRLQLEDRFGSMIAARDFEPADYLSSEAAAARMLTPGASGEAELVLADPGDDAVGYRLDVCLRDQAGQLLCAQSPGPG